MAKDFIHVGAAVLLPLVVACGGIVAHFLCTATAAPKMLSLKNAADDEAFLTSKLDAFATWHAWRAVFQFLTFWRWCGPRWLPVRPHRPTTTNPVNGRMSATWFRIVAGILCLFGLFFIVFGLKVFSEWIPIIPHDVLLPWESSLYGAVIVGWGVTRYLVGRVAFRRRDRELKKALAAGLAGWLALEAAASAWLGVWFNVGVDVVVFILFAVPLLRTDRA